MQMLFANCFRRGGSSQNKLPLARWNITYAEDFYNVFNAQLLHYREGLRSFGDHLVPSSLLRAAEALVDLEKETRSLVAGRGSPVSLPFAFDPPESEFPNYRVMERGPWRVYFCLDVLRRKAVALTFVHEPDEFDQRVRLLRSYRGYCSKR